MRISGSVLERIALCPGSASLEASVAFPEVPSEQALRGTQLHKCMARYFEGRDKVLAEAVGQGLTRSEDIDALNWCMDELEKQNLKSVRAFQVERERDMRWVHPACKPTTPDLVLFYNNGEICIDDWKFGFTPVEDAQTNWQLLYYALSVAHDTPTEKSAIHVRVLQPATQGVSSGTFTRDELDDALIKIQLVINNAERQVDSYRPGKHCRYCKAALICPVAERGLAQYAAAAAGPVPVTALAVPTLEAMYTPIQTAKAWIKQYEERLYAVLAAGGGQKLELVEGRQNRAWKSEAAATKVLSEMEAAEESLKGKLVVSAPVSPAQAEKLLGTSKAVRETLAPVLEYRAGKKKIVRKEA